MKKKIHPQYYKKAEIKCSCGNVIKVGSTQEEMEIEICSACHPFYTGKKKLVDTAGQVDRFKKRLEKSKEMKSKEAKKPKKKPAKKKTSKAKTIKL